MRVKENCHDEEQRNRSDYDRRPKDLTQKWHQLSGADSEIIEVLKKRALTVEEARTVLEVTEAEIERQAVSAVRNTSIASAVMSVRPIQFRCKEQRLQQLDAAAKAAGLPGIPKEIEDATS